MRILHVTDGYRPRVGGIEIFVENLANRQAAAGHEVSVLTASPAARADTDDAQGPVRLVRTPRSIVHPLAPRAARDAAVTGLYDVVHSHLSVVSPFATVVARACDEAGISTVNTVHSMWGSRRSLVRVVRGLADWDRSTTTWTAVSHAAAAEMYDVLRPGTFVHVVPNAVDVAWWRSGTRARRARPDVTLVSVMRLAARKRPGALLRIFDRLRTSLPDGVEVRLVIVGAGPLARQMHAEIAARGLHDQVTMAGCLSRAQIRDVYALADVFVSPARQESFGLAALEARAVGLPVVAMEGGVGEFIERGVDGLLCRDDEAMVEALAKLVLDAPLRARLASHNAAHAPAHDWPRTLTCFEEVYHQALLERTASRATPVTG